MNGPNFYQMPINESTLTLVKQDSPVLFDEQVQIADEHVVVFDPGEALFWAVESVNQ